jgi:hypothetical protein
VLRAFADFADLKPRSRADTRPGSPSWPTRLPGRPDFRRRRLRISGEPRSFTTSDEPASRTLIPAALTAPPTRPTPGRPAGRCTPARPCCW